MGGQDQGRGKQEACWCKGFLWLLMDALFFMAVSVFSQRVLLWLMTGDGRGMTLSGVSIW